MNIKMRGQRIVEVPEIEGNLPCEFFGKGTCPGCYSETLYPIRRAKVKGNAKTPPRGLLRAGVWREWTPDDWKRFKTMYPTRRYFLVTRGLWSKEHHELVLAGPVLCQPSGQHLAHRPRVQVRTLRCYSGCSRCLRRRSSA